MFAYFLLSFFYNTSHHIPLILSVESINTLILKHFSAVLAAENVTIYMIGLSMSMAMRQIFLFNHTQKHKKGGYLISGQPP